MNLLQVKLNTGYFKCNFHIITLDLEYHVFYVVKIRVYFLHKSLYYPANFARYSVTITHGTGGKHADSFRGKYSFG